MNSDPNAAIARYWSVRCPQCSMSDEIDIAATVWVRLCPNGTDPTLAANGDQEWTDDSGACCNACGFHAQVREFQITATDDNSGGRPVDP
jgi:hypothetical protein